MTILLGIIAVICFVLLITFFVANKILEKRVADAEQKTEHMRLQFESDIAQIHKEAQAALAESQKLVDQQSEDLKSESARVRQHYHDEARKIQNTANAMVAKALKELEPLQKYAKLKDAEAEVQRQLAEALNEATSMRAEAKAFLEQARTTATEERTQAKQSVKSIHEQADARLDQAIKDAGRIIADAEKRAKDIGGDAYAALQEKRTLEEAAQAMRNIVEGYGDRYLVPTHSLLDDLAAEYSYDAAGQSLTSAREQSRRMVEQGQAAACDYVEANRRTTAIQFVIHAFNGSVDAILTRTKSDNYGVLERKIRDVYAIVNLDGSAFRNARILPAYLDARLAELKWAVTVQELAMRDREEQRYLKEQERDRQKAEQERLKQLREAEKEKEIKQAALIEAEARLAQAHAEERSKFEQEVQRLRQEVIDATRQELTIAQRTNKGRIYVISNVGSFGEGVYKIGLTRREAQERVYELSGASVPFEFDIHAVIETDNAPALEYKIHQQFVDMRINKINMRKEFFRVTLNDIRARVESLARGKDYLGDVTWTEKARAQNYYDSLDIERDPVAKERWIKRARLVAEHRQRDTIGEVVVNDDEELDGDTEPQAGLTGQPDNITPVVSPGIRQVGGDA
jgi:hypothetical protein